MTPTADTSTNTARILAATLRWSILAAPLLILLAAHVLTSSRLAATPQNTTSKTASSAIPLQPAAAPDDWRRTANGWERIHTWPTATSHSWSFFGTRNQKANTSTTSSRAATRAPRLDTHPAVLALAQLLASVLALTLFRNPNHAPLHLSSLLSTIDRSFRASAFGS